MESRKFEDSGSLKSYLASFGDDVLYRGQIHHYADQDGLPKITTSMEREGCYPPLMFKWMHYAYESLQLDPGFDGDSDTAQALLQHYGWRSFYIDCSKNYAVASWFAGNQFRSTVELNITEDCFEEAFFLRTNRAEYVHSEGIGNLYVVSVEKVNDIGRIFDLERIPEDIASRPHRQAGVLVGPIPFRREWLRLDVSCILAHAMAPASVFRKLAAEQGIIASRDLFPNGADDYFLRYLQSLPLVEDRKSGNRGLLVFAPALPIPDYDPNLHKICPARIAFASQFWLADRRKGRADALSQATFYKVPEKLFHVVSIPMPMQFGNVRALLAKHKMIVIESAGILRYPLQIGTSEYTKGVVLSLDDPLIQIAELVVDHPGHKVASDGVLLGHYFKWKEYTLEREITKDDCPCNNERRHLRLLTAVAAFNEVALTARQIGPNLYEIKEPN